MRWQLRPTRRKQPSPQWKVPCRLLHYLPIALPWQEVKCCLCRNNYAKEQKLCASSLASKVPSRTLLLSISHIAPHQCCLHEFQYQKAWSSHKTDAALLKNPSLHSTFLGWPHLHPIRQSHFAFAKLKLFLISHVQFCTERSIFDQHLLMLHTRPMLKFAKNPQVSCGKKLGTLLTKLGCFHKLCALASIVGKVQKPWKTAWWWHILAKLCQISHFIPAGLRRIAVWKNKVILGHNTLWKLWSPICMFWKCLVMGLWSCKYVVFWAPRVALGNAPRQGTSSVNFLGDREGERR